MPVMINLFPMQVVQEVATPVEATSPVEAVMKEAEKQKIKPKDDEELQRTLPYLKSQLKALVARDLFDMSEYFQIINETSDIVKKGVELSAGK